MINSIIKDGLTGNKAKVLDNGALVVQQADLLQVETEKINIFNGFLTDTGEQAGNKDARVNGSINSIEYYITPENQEKDLYISSCIFTIADQNATLNQFGNIGALANGFDFFYENDLGTNIIRTGLTTNFEIGRMAGGGVNLTRYSNVSGTSEGFVFRYDFKTVNGYSRGLVLSGGTNQRLVLKINDNITGVDLFDIYVSGFERIK